MARDVLLGRTTRSWCRGDFPAVRRRGFSDVLASQKVAVLAAETFAEVDRAFAEVVKRSGAGTIAPDQRRAFRRVLEARQSLAERDLTPDDQVEVENLRDACRRYVAAVLKPAAAATASSAAPPAPSPPTPPVTSPAPAPPAPAPTIGGLAVVGLAGCLYVVYRSFCPRRTQ